MAFGLACGMAIAGEACATLQVTTARPTDGAPPPAAAIETALAEVSAERLRADVLALVACGTRHPLSPTEDPKRGVGAARAWIRSRFEEAVDASDGRASLREQPFDRKLSRNSEVMGHFVNFIFELPGSDPTRGVWVIGGHYDSRNREANDGTRDAPGADDDASGTAVVLELARRIAGDSPQATVLLCAFDGEELGLFGSDVLAEELKQQGREVEGMVTNDIVGASRGPDRSTPPANWLRCFSEAFPDGAEKEPFFATVGGESDGPSRQLARFADVMTERYLHGFDLRLVLRRDRFGRGGDHESFTKRGAPGIRFTEAVEDYRHQHEEVRVVEGIQHGDLPEFVDFDYVAQVARVNLALLMNGAGAPPPPARVHLDGAVKHDVTIQWSGVPEGAAVAGQRVWWRATESAAWQKELFVACGGASGGATEVTLPGISVDDFQFGVASVGRDGRESPVRFPTAKPRRARDGAAGK